MITTAVILAAGLGSRLRPYTDHHPKGFIPVHGTPIVIQSIEKLITLGVTRIIIGTGYMKSHYEALQVRYPQVTCVENPDYEVTGSMATLACCQQAIGSDGFLLLESDLVYPQYALSALMSVDFPTVMLGSGMTQSGDEVYIQYDAQFRLQKLSKKPDELDHISAELVGINKISTVMLTQMVDYFNQANQPKLDYEGTMALIGAENQSVYVHKIDDLPWCEVDTEDHLKRAHQLYASMLNYLG